MLSLCLSNPSGLQIEDRLTAAEPCDQTGQKADWTKWGNLSAPGSATTDSVLSLCLWSSVSSSVNKTKCIQKLQLSMTAAKYGGVGNSKWLSLQWKIWQKLSESISSEFWKNGQKLTVSKEMLNQEKDNCNLVKFCGILTYLCPFSTPHSSGGLEDGIPRPWYGFLGPGEALWTLSQDTIAVCLDLAMGSLKD